MNRCTICGEIVQDPPQAMLDYRAVHYICVSILIADQEGRHEARKERAAETTTP